MHKPYVMGVIIKACNSLAYARTQLHVGGWVYPPVHRNCICESIKWAGYINIVIRSVKIQGPGVCYGPRKVESKRSRAIIAGYTYITCSCPGSRPRESDRETGCAICAQRST